MPLHLFWALTTPKSILKKVWNFLWQGPGANKKWALVAWKTLCLSKDEGGLDLCDLEALSVVLGTKIWWRWLKNQSGLWAKLWKHKYAPQFRPQDLIQTTNLPKGSQIWNLADNNKQIIQQHCFWEILNGSIALFWQDSWDKNPKHPLLPPLQHIRDATPNYQAYKVCDYWKEIDRNTSDWREWIPLLRTSSDI